MRPALPLIAALLLACPLVQSAEPLPKVHVFSVERNTCGAWRLSAANPRARQAQYFWFLGFVSGSNLSTPERQVTAARMLNEVEFEKYVTAKCNDRPEDTLVAIAKQFVEVNSLKGEKK